MCWKRQDMSFPAVNIRSTGQLTCLFASYVSGSAYKIVNNRAYHHGTMLISTELDTLGDLLHTNKVSL